MEGDGGDQDITNEIGPGCYPLELDVEHFGHSVLWIRGLHTDLQ